MLLSRRRVLARLRDLGVMLPLWSAHAAGAGAGSPPAAQVLDPDARQTLARLCRRVMPVPRITDASLDAVVTALDLIAAQQTTLRALLIDGCEHARVHLAAPAAAAADAIVDAYLTAISSTPFFELVRSTTVATLLDDHAVWAIAGYEGESLSHGGYLYRGFNDLDWLPAPPAAVMGDVA